MSNKKLYLVFGLMLAVFAGLIWSFASAVSFTLDFWGWYDKPETWWTIRQNMVPIHFADNWNDFHWFMYFSDGIVVDVTPSTGHTYYVKFGTSMMECQKKVKWFYYNAERWERLWPLDGSYGGITANDWIYTRCRQEGYTEALKTRCTNMGEKEREDCESKLEEEFVDSYGYYWMVTHDSNGQKFALVVWTDYDVPENWMVMWDQLVPTFVRINNKYPVWFIYDVNWWAWFVWCEINEWSTAQDVLYKFNETQNINGTITEKNWHNLFKRENDKLKTDYLPVECDGWSAMNSLIKVVVDGLVGINKDTKNTGIQWNQSNAKMQYFSSVSVNNMQLINYARQRAEILCRWKWRDSYAPNPGGIVCVNNPWTIINPSTNETLLVKWWSDVQIKDMADFGGTDYYDIFVDGGNLLIEPNNAVTDLTVFKKNWFKSENSLDGFSTAVSSALAAGHDYSGNDAAAWRFIRGNFIINGNIKPAGWYTGLENIYFIYGKMTSKDTVDELEKVFVWKCNAWKGSDSEHVPCPWWWKDVDGNVWNNPYQNASLVIIDQNYSSPLYK